MEQPGIVVEHKRVKAASWRVFDEYWIIGDEGLKGYKGVE